MLAKPVPPKELLATVAQHLRWPVRARAPLLNLGGPPEHARHRVAPELIALGRRQGAARRTHGPGIVAVTTGIGVPSGIATLRRTHSATHRSRLFARQGRAWEGRSPDALLRARRKTAHQPAASGQWRAELPSRLGISPWRDEPEACDLRRIYQCPMVVTDLKLSGGDHEPLVAAAQFAEISNSAHRAMPSTSCTRMLVGGINWSDTTVVTYQQLDIVGFPLRRRQVPVALPRQPSWCSIRSAWDRLHRSRILAGAPRAAVLCRKHGVDVSRESLSRLLHRRPMATPQLWAAAGKDQRTKLRTTPYEAARS